MLEPNVVIVEDDEAMRQALVRLVGTAGYGVRAFARAEEFLDADPPIKPQCFVLDVQLPDMSGFQLYERLSVAGEAVPAIFISAHDEPAVRSKAEQTGGVFLPKPFTGKALIAAIKHATGAGTTNE